MVDVEFHPVLAATSALNAPEAVSAQHAIAHRARDFGMFLVVGYTPVLILQATLLSFFFFFDLRCSFISIVRIVSATQRTMAIWISGMSDWNIWV